MHTLKTQKKPRFLTVRKRRRHIPLTRLELGWKWEHKRPKREKRQREAAARQRLRQQRAAINRQLSARIAALIAGLDRRKEFNDMIQ